ncbi:unnamed protein product [Effrenium voratum]|uniref:Uncharacterized protein n=1 Tax=Effrenium voratum TaxID=2562239 RepID=A0AA36MT41_9DINO|nr:unnamed protein product [Effrenium voratum]
MFGNTHCAAGHLVRPAFLACPSWATLSLFSVGAAAFARMAQMSATLEVIRLRKMFFLRSLVSNIRSSSAIIMVLTFLATCLCFCLPSIACNICTVENRRKQLGYGASEAPLRGLDIPEQNNLSLTLACKQ